ncbi:MAG: hypothetical protein ACRCZ9_12060 [Fusobacteriaceae bacterium]
MEKPPLAYRLKMAISKNHDIVHQQGGTWIQLSCPFCGDSPNPRTKHLNIRLTDDNLFVIKCFQTKCDIGGFLNKKKLHRLGVYDNNIIGEVQMLYNRNKGMIHTYTGEENYSHIGTPLKKGGGIILPLSVPDVVTDYFKKRTNMTLDNEYIHRYRIVSNFKDFETDNNIPRGVLKRITDGESKGYNYIGFLNNSRTQVFIRAINDPYLKHVKIPIVDIPEYMRHEEYSIFDNFDMEENNNVFIAEGLFDIINTHKHISGGSSGVFIAAATANAIPRLTNKYADTTYHSNFIFVSDSDVHIGFYRRIIKERNYRFGNVSVVYNNIGKDVGDIGEPIELTRIDIHSVKI